MLLLRNPISSTKKLFRKTLNSFKSLFSSPSYHKLSKTSLPKQTLNTQTPSSSTRNNNNNKTMVLVSSSSSTTSHDRGKPVHVNNTKEKVKDPNTSMRRDQERRGFVAERLRELEMVDVGNIDHKLDIEEVLHYYSRLTCQPYLHIVDTLFIQIFAEFSDPKLNLDH